MKTAKNALELALRFATEAWDRAQQQQLPDGHGESATATTASASANTADAASQDADPLDVSLQTHQARRRLRDLVAAHSFKGVYLQAAGDMDQALGALDHAIHVAESSPLSTTAAASLPVESKETTADGSQLLGGAALDEDQAMMSDLYCRRAANRFNAERYDDCLRDCDAALRHSSGSNHLVRLLRGQCYMFADRYADAISDLQLYLQAEEKARYTISSSSPARVRDVRGPGERSQFPPRTQYRQSVGSGQLHNAAADAQRQQVRDIIEQCRRALASSK
jgi:tetratricopeptide (TPR) repeat protein